MVCCGDCLWCGAPQAEAPTFFAPFDDTYTDTYFVAQPVTPEVKEQTIMPARVGSMIMRILAAIFASVLFAFLIPIIYVLLVGVPQSLMSLVWLA